MGRLTTQTCPNAAVRKVEAPPAYDDGLDRKRLVLHDRKSIQAQYAGRLHRLHDGKREVIVYDYADLRVAMLARMFQRRKRGYHAIGYEIGPQCAADDIPKESCQKGDSE